MSNSEADLERLRAALRQSEGRFAGLMDALGEMVWRCRADGTDVQVFGLERTGVAPNELLNFNWTTSGAIHPQDVAIVQHAWAECRETGRPLRLIFRARSADGSYKWVRSQAVALRDENGAITEWIGTASSVDEQRRAEEMLLRANARQQCIIDAQIDVSRLGLSKDQIMQRVATRARDAVVADVVGIATPTGEELDYTVIVGCQQTAGVRVHMDASLTGWCFRNRQSVRVADCLADDRNSMIAARRFGVTSVMLVPIATAQGVMGVLFAGAKRRNAFNEDDLPALEVFAGIMSAAIANAIAFEERQLLVAERTAAIEQLRTSEALFRALTEHSDELINILNEDGTIRYTSPSVTRILGYEPHELYGKRPSEFVHPDDYDTLMATFKAIGRDERPQGARLRLRHNDGSWRWVEGSGRNLMHVTAIRGITTNVRDVTEAVRNAEHVEFQAKLLATVEQAVIAMDLEGRVTFWSRHAERLYGWSASEMMGKPLRDYLVAPGMGQRAAEIRAHVHAGHGWSGEFEVMRRDGSSFVALVSDTPIYDASGKLIGIVGVSSDITARRELETQLRQAQKMDAIGQLAGGVAHDFNNILTAITAYTELLLEEAKSGPIHDDLCEIQTAARRAADLTSQLLAFSRKQMMQVETLDVVDVVRGMEKMLRRMIPESITLHTSYPATALYVEADRGQLEQVMLNLVVNARDAMPDGGHLTIGVSTLGTGDGALRADIIVADTGIGMDESVQRRVFEPFFTTKPEGKGTGLGLSVVYGIIEQLGGTITVDSAPQAGATFHIALPVSRAGGPASASDAPPPERGSERILLVEDNDALAGVASRVLQRLGYTVVRAPNGRAALHLFDNGLEADLVLTDVVMPEMSGPSLIEELGRRGTAPAVLYTSGYTAGADLAAAREWSTAHFLPKPWTPRELAQAVRDALDEHRALAV